MDGWWAVGAVARGVSHQANGHPCQDALGYRFLCDGVLIAALADGAGSAEKADQGAQAAVDAALDCMETALAEELLVTQAEWEDLAHRAFVAARTRVINLAEAEGEPVRSYASTLTCLIATAYHIVAGALGDGVVVAGEVEGDLQAVTQIQRGEYANETYFLTQDQALENLQIVAVYGTFDRVAMMSDGLTRLALKLPAYQPHRPFFQPLFTFALDARQADGESRGWAEAQLRAFLTSERVCARTDDDKSLLLAVRTPERVMAPVQAFEPGAGDSTPGS